MSVAVWSASALLPLWTSKVMDAFKETCGRDCVNAAQLELFGYNSELGLCVETKDGQRMGYRISLEDAFRKDLSADSILDYAAIRMARQYAKIETVSIDYRTWGPPPAAKIGLAWSKWKELCSG